MSGYLPLGTSLQLSTSDGSIYHKKILASNVEGTPTLSSFPTTSTGSTKGSYEFHDGVSKHLNASGILPSGHEFYTSSSTASPKLNLTVNNDSILTDTNFTVDKSSTGFLGPDVLSLSLDGKTIFFDPSIDFTQPPYNFNQTFNPIFMKQSTALYSLGSLCYAVLGSGESMQIFNNDESTNPIPPNTVPSDFGNSSNVGITIGEPLFSVGGSGSIQKAIVSEVFETQFEENHAVLAPSILSFYDDNLSSSFSLTDIIFDGVSYKGKIDNNEVEIKNNKILSVNTYSIFSSPAIYADGNSPAQCPSSITNTYPYFGWYYKNSNTSGINKVNWYVAPKNSTFTVGQLLGFYLKFFNVSTTNKNNSPFINVYTKMDNITPNAGSFYKSRQTYLITTNPTINTHYSVQYKKDSSVPDISIYNSNLLYFTESTRQGSYADTEEILFYAISSNSSSPLNSIEFICQKFGVMNTDCSDEFEMMPLLN